MIGLIAGDSFHANLLERQINASGQNTRRLASIEEAKDDEFEILFIQYGAIEIPPDWPFEKRAIIGINMPSEMQDNFHENVKFPVNWPALSRSLNISEDALFDKGTQSEIIELLGEDAYRASLDELISQADQAVARLDDLPAIEQISEVHKISGAAAMLGVLGLHKKLMRIEIEGKEGTQTRFVELRDKFLKDWPEIKHQIEAEAVAL